MFDKNGALLSIGDNVKVYLFFDGVIEDIIKYDNGKYWFAITWEMRSGFKFGKFYSEEVSLAK